ncbi:hypothetical protein ACHAWO_004499 [Cyclotella atomus]|uniref:Uncharacterized protein n=1 Tax=Cyclotella atomus TaxID=382360 RepID=A0ABD3NIE8_9STRA
MKYLLGLMHITLPGLFLSIQSVQVSARHHEGFSHPSFTQKQAGHAYPSAFVTKREHKILFARHSSIAHLSPTPYESDEVQKITTQIIDEYELDGRFERWSFLQQLLENELPLKDVEDAIIAVFNGYLLHGPTVDDIEEVTVEKSVNDNKGLPSPVLDDEMRGSIRKLISDILFIKDISEESESRFLHLFVQPPIDYEMEVLMGTLMDKSDDAATSDINPQALSLVEQIEKLLPDPVEDEDAHKSAWDLVIELYGREGVRVREENIQRNGVDGSKENMSWKILCCIGRVLIHYDFLNKGILSG